jgi:hypothetical protein
LRAFAAHREDWELSKKVTDQSKIRWAISTFKPFKSAGTDGIVPALLQQRVEHLTTHLCRIFRACLARGYIPKAWRQVKVTFIPKPGKAKYTEAKAYRLISLSCYMLKPMKKLVDRHIRAEILGLHPLHQNQFAYQPGKSTETALHHVITHIQNAVENSKVTIGTFLNIDGAFDSTFDIITKTAKRHRLGDMICRWVGPMLGSRKITATLAGEILERSVVRGCSQGGVLSPLLWSMVVNELIGRLNGNGYYTLGHANDIAIHIHGKLPNTVSELLQEALSMVQQWCDRTQLSTSINPQKMVIIPFTRKRD